MSLIHRSKNNSLRFWIKIMIIFIIIISCVIIILFINQRKFFSYENSKYIKDIENNSETTIINNLENGFENGIDIVIVCSNKQFNEMSINLIKSIMFYHRKSSNITFHIFTDYNGIKLIQNFINSIENICTKFRIYKIEKLLKIGKNFLKENNIINKHYSGIYSLSKAFIHEVLPSYISRVILIDSDIIFLDDIYSIWQQFNLFIKNKTALALTRWYPLVPIDYQYKGSQPDPFLTGIVLLDLNVCRSINLTKLLNEITKMSYIKFKLRSLWSADQTLLSLFATYFSKYFVILPCFINGHTYHYLKNGETWKRSCPGEYPRTIHVVPSSSLFEKEVNYYGHLYIFIRDMPFQWLSYCAKEIS